MNAVNTELQQEALDVLTSIYPTSLLWETTHGGITVTVTVPVEFGRDRQVHVEEWEELGHDRIEVGKEDDGRGLELVGNATDEGNGVIPQPSGSGGAQADEAPPSGTTPSLRYLPPLTLDIFLPPTYPTDAPPTVTIKESTGWFSHDWTGILQTFLDSLWTGEQCLYSIIESCEADSLLSLLDVSFPLLISPSQSTPSHRSMSTTLVRFDEGEKRKAFQEENYACAICLEPKKGRDCVRLRGCRCVFCSPCLKSYFTLLITEGLVASVLCPSLACVSARKVLSTTAIVEGAEVAEERGIRRDELDEIVGVEMGKRWEGLREKNRLESDPSISFCPQVRCRAAVPAMVDDEKLRICPSCGHTFCVLCLKTWHGPSNACTLSLSSTLVSLFLSSTPSARRILEAKYGKRNLEKLVRVVEEDRVNKEWMEGSTTPCPNCSVRVEKTEGCAHMQCTRCSTHFCYRCGAKLPSLEPYAHYSAMNTPCYNKLFDFLPGQEPLPAEWLEDGFAGLEM